MKNVIIYILGFITGAVTYILLFYPIDFQYIQKNIIYFQNNLLSKKSTKTAISNQPKINIEDEENLKKLKFIRKNLENMTFEDKIGQLFIWGFSGQEISKSDFELFSKIHAGGILLMGNYTNNDIVKNLTREIQKVSSSTPLIIAVDQEGEPVSHLKMDANPGAKILGELSENDSCRFINKTSSILNNLGINLNFGTIADIGLYEGSFIKERTYASDSAHVSKYVYNYIKCAKSTLNTIKHFPGHGRTMDDSHSTIPIIDIDYETWEKTDGKPFKNGINYGIDAIMIGHLLYPSIASEPASLSKFFVNELRKNGFSGLIVTDDMGMLESSGFDAFEVMDKALLAGNDILVYSNTTKDKDELFLHAVSFVKNGGISEKELDEKIKHILAMKYEALKKMKN